MGLAPIADTSCDVRILTTPQLSRGKTLCTISMDDLCPAPKTALGIDLGGEPGTGVAKDIENLLRAYPHIGLTLFVMPDFKAPGAAVLDCSLVSPKNADWVRYYLDWTNHFHVEFGLHGLHHRQNHNLLFSRHVEFAFASLEEACEAVCAGYAILASAGFVVSGFRQPGWDINSDFSIIPAVRAAGLSYIAGSSLDAGFNARSQRVSNYFPSIINDLLNLPQNIELDWPLARMCEEAARISAVGGMISAKAHVADRVSPNALTRSNVDKLKRFLDFLYAGGAGEIEYTTFGKIARSLPLQDVQLRPGVLALGECHRKECKR